MKKCVKFFLLIIISGIVAFGQQHRPKVGLVLSGGGAKGVAHIEILKILDSLNFPVDYIAGTSMRGLIGGFYAIGYTGKEIEDLIGSFNWKVL